MSETGSDTKERTAEIVTVVRDVLAPMIAADGGTIEWIGVVNGTAEVRLGGACAGCPGQPFTAHAVILPALRCVDPTITRVAIKSAP